MSSKIINKKSPKTKEEKIASFRNYSATMEKLYRGERTLSNKTEHHTASRRYFNIQTKADVERLLERAYSNPKDAAEVSETLHDLDSNYAKIISYFANMFYVRYTVIPTQVDRETSIGSPEYMEIYNQMIDIVDGSNLEVAIPEILKDVFIKGSVYLYGAPVASADTVSILSLPNEYCRTVYKTNQGTNIIEFDMSYFDQFIGDDLEVVFDIYPSEFQSLYNEYQGQSTGDEWFQLDEKLATSLFKNDSEMPPFLKAIEGILEYEGFRANELKRSDNLLKSILTHRIPIFEDEPIFDVEEVGAIQKEVSKIVRRHEGLETITVFGETELIRLQEEGSVENKQIDQSYKTVFNAAGLNSAVFTGDSDLALGINQSTDEAYVWQLFSQFNQYINILINNLYQFAPYQAEVNFLPISMNKEDSQISRYRENATFGLGRIEALVATGMKQKHLSDRKRLEDELQLDELLKPLESSHTQSRKEGDEEKDNDSEEVENDNEPDTKDSDDKPEDTETETETGGEENAS